MREEGREKRLVLFESEGEGPFLRVYRGQGLVRRKRGCSGLPHEATWPEPRANQGLGGWVWGRLEQRSFPWKAGLTDGLGNPTSQCPGNSAGCSVAPAQLNENLILGLGISVGPEKGSLTWKTSPCSSPPWAHSWPNPRKQHRAPWRQQILLYSFSPTNSDFRYLTMALHVHSKGT